MRTIRHPSAQAFLARAEPWLLQFEAENSLMLGAATQATSLCGDSDRYLWATIEDRGRVVACGTRTPPFDLLLSRGASDAWNALLGDLQGYLRDISGVLGTEPDVRSFVRSWSDRAGKEMTAAMRQRVYKLQQLDPPTRPFDGQLRLAAERDVSLLVDWVGAFDATPQPTEDRERFVRRLLSEQRLFLWDCGGPRSMAAWAGSTAHGARINMVYTPPPLRREGFASACVRALSQRLLNGGHAFCCLVTDLENSTSNSIYQRIGYRAVCEQTHFRFAQ